MNTEGWQREEDRKAFTTVAQALRGRSRCDNLATHKTPLIHDWLARHLRFHVHFTPTGSSWLNQVER